MLKTSKLVSPQRNSNAILMVVLALSTATTSGAGLLLSFRQSQSDVTIQMSGSLDLSGLSYAGEFQGSKSEVFVSNGGTDWIWSGLVFGSDIYSFPSALDIFSEPVFLLAGQPSGDQFGLWRGPGTVSLYFEDGFSGGNIDGVLTIPDVTLASLGVIEGIATWGPTPEQSITLDVIPEPSVTSLFGLGAATLIWRRGKADQKKRTRRGAEPLYSRS